MKPTRAIKELSHLYQVGLNRLTPDEKKAVKLGEEALKEYQKLKLTTVLPIGYKLPGETTE